MGLGGRGDFFLEEWRTYIWRHRLYSTIIRKAKESEDIDNNKARTKPIWKLKFQCIFKLFDPEINELNSKWLHPTTLFPKFTVQEIF